MDDARYASWDDFHRTGVEPELAPLPPGASFGLDPDGAPVGFSPNPARASDPTRPARRASGNDNNSNNKKIPKILAGWRVRFAQPKLVASATPSARSSGAPTPRFARDRGASPAPPHDETAPTPTPVASSAAAAAAAAAPDGAFTITGLPPFVSNALHTLRGMPVVRLSREVRTPGFRVGVDGRQLCAIGELRIVACPDVAVGYNGVLVGEHPEDAVRVSLDVESGVSPEGYFRTTAGIHLEASVLSRRFPDRFSAGVAVAAVVDHASAETRDDDRSRSRGGSNPHAYPYPHRSYRGSGGSSSRRASLARESGGSSSRLNLDRESGAPSSRDRDRDRSGSASGSNRRRPPPQHSRPPLAARREDVWWARVRLWRGVYLRVSSECRATSDGRLAFAAPTWELAAEADPTQSDPARDHWSFHARGTAAAEARERRKARTRTRTRNASGLEFEPADDDDDDLRDREADEAHVRDRLEREFRSPEEVARRRVESDRAARREERRARRDEEARERAAFRERARREDAERRARVRERRAERTVLARERVAERREMAARRRREREEAREERIREREAREEEREMIREAEEERKAFEREEARRAKEEAEKGAGEEDAIERDAGGAGPKANRRDDIGKDADENKKKKKKRVGADDEKKVGADDEKKEGAVESVEPAVASETAATRLEAADPGPTGPSAEASNVNDPSGSSTTGTASETADASSSASSTSASVSSASASASASAGPPLSRDERLRRADRARFDAARAAAAAAAREEAEAKREADRVAAETAARNERAREETRRRAEQELKDIAAAAEARAKAAAREAKAAKRREAAEARRAALDARDARRREEEEKRAWAKAEAEARARAEAEARRARDAAAAEERRVENEARRAEFARARAERLAAFEEERERKDRAAAEEREARAAARAAEEDAARAASARAAAASSAAFPPRSSEASSDASPRIRGHRTTVALVPGHWIDPGEESGAPGERALNLVIANRAHRLLDARGWTVLRPDLASPPLSWDEYVAWVRAQTRGGVAVLEVHGQGEGASMEGRVTGVIAQRESALGDALAVRFGVFPMDWTELAVPRLGGAVVESFDATALERLPPEARTAAVDDIAKDIADAVESTRRGAEPPDGCSASGCPRA